MRSRLSCSSTIRRPAPVVLLSVVLAVVVSLAACAPAGDDDGFTSPLVEQARANTYRLPNGWSISPIGMGIEMGDLVLNIVNTPDGEYMIALNSGYNEHELTIFEIETAAVVERVPLPTSWMGMAWSPDGTTLYVSGGNDRRGESAPLHVFSYDQGGPPFLTRVDAPVFVETFEWMAGDDPQGVRDFPVDEGAASLGANVFWSGLLHHPTRDILYAANRTAGHVVVFNSETGAIEARIRTGVNPYDLVLSPDANTLYVSNWASASVSVIDTETHTVRRTIQVDENPNDMTLGSDGRLWVACANDNTVVVIDTATERAVGKIITSMWDKDPAGSTPNYVLLDDDEDTLYVANADNNNLAVIDVTPGDESRVLGFIPTASYPSALAMSADGSRIAVGSGKGTTSSSNLRGPHIGADGGDRVPADEGVAGTIKTLTRGSVHVFGVPSSGAELKALTQRAYQNTPYHEDLLVEATAPAGESIIPTVVGQTSPIKHVIYVLKENRTYDQILGDIEKGNGDPRIALFGREITPNHHALAEQFALFDNYYVDAEVSVDGHSWSDAAYATDFNEKNWPADYGGRVSRPPYTDAAEPPAGYIWELAGRAGLTYRSYGEKANHPSLVGHAAPGYPGWGADLDVENAEAFLREFDEYERNYDSLDPEERLPNFIMLQLPNDHTYGGSPGRPTPEASVAANDLALGMIVERVTQSRYWAETAIFVTEDDAQDGSDHVDAHRSIVLVISPYTKRGIVDSTHYTTSSILRTVELLLGLPPLTQFDAAATPFYNAMGTTLDPTPYAALPANIDLTAVNPQRGYGAEESLAMDFSEFDRTPMFELNEIIWKLVKGVDSEMPLPVHRYDISAVFPPGR